MELPKNGNIEERLKYDSQPSRLLTCYLAEYNSLRTEQLSRLQAQTQSFNYLLIVLGAAVGALVTALSKPELFWSVPTVLITIALLLPILAGPLAFIFFDNEMAVFSIGSRIYADVRPRLAEITGDPGVLENSLAFKNLPKSSASIHGRLSMARWILFLVPTALPTLAIILFLVLDWRRVVPISDALTTSQILVCGFLFLLLILDVVMCIITLQAIRWSFRTLARLHA